jgi:hypothetical protein
VKLPCRDAVWSRLVQVLFAGVVLALAGCGSGSESNGAEPAAAERPEVAQLDSVLPLRAAFNDDRGKPRLLLLLSPT